MNFAFHILTWRPLQNIAYYAYVRIITGNIAYLAFFPITTLVIHTHTYIYLTEFSYMCIFLHRRNEARRMHPARYITILFVFVVFSSIFVFGFPDGAPVDTCVKPRPNQPYHGQARSQPLNTSPYKILASSSQYGPGSQITGKSNICQCSYYILFN